MERFIRTENLIGKDTQKILTHSKVIVFGIGGVGSYTCEALARAGIGEITLVDNDVVSESNINRQIVALNSTIGKHKVDVMADRISDINPDCKITRYSLFYTRENEIDISDYDYIVDAIDTVTSKIALIEKANEFNIPIISSMGTGNKLDPTKFEVADIYNTSVCPLAKVIRHELRKLNIQRLKVVYSKEMPKTDNNECDKRVPASISFVPSVCGLIIAGEVIKDLIKE